MSVSDDWSAWLFGYRLVANSIEFHQNYFPRVGHGPCAVRFDHYEGCTKGIADAFILDLPREAAPVPRYADVTSALLPYLSQTKAAARGWTAAFGIENSF